jgi:hypothetical protein
MNTPNLPDLSKLSDTEKDELITSLWETLQAVENARSPTENPVEASFRPTRTVDTVSDLRKRIQATAPSRRAQIRVRNSHHWLLKLADYRPLRIAVLLTAFGFLIDFAISWHQRQTVLARSQAIQSLNAAAFSGFYVEIASVAYEPDGKTYRATLSMKNSQAGKPLYVMLDPLRAYVQSGLAWQEVATRSPEGASSRVVKVDGSGEYSVLFETDVKDWSQLIPGYMHVLIQSEMLISQSSTPADDIVERKNRFYVYLKPQGADDEDIKRRSNFPGKPPVYIRMPPH